MAYKDDFHARLKTKYPDKNFDDEEELYKQVGTDYDDYENQIKGYKDSEDKLVNMFSDHPKSALLFSAIKEGKNPAVELIRIFGDDIKEAIDDPEKLEEIQEAQKDYLDRVTKSKELDEEYKQNLQKSLEILDQYQQKNNLSDEQADKIMETLIKIASDMVVGNFNEDTLDMVKKSINHEEDIKNAEEDGRVAGRNEKIVETLKKPPTKDGSAALPHSNIPKPEVRDFKPRHQSVWAEAQEKRTPRN